MIAERNEDDASPYLLLLELLGQELELAGSGRLTDAAAISARRAELIAGLPATPPAAAGPALREARLLRRRLEIELLRGRDALTQALARLEQARRTAGGYAPARRPSRVVASA